MKQLSQNIKRMPVDTWNRAGVNRSEIKLYSVEDAGDANKKFTNFECRHNLERNFNEFNPDKKIDDFFINDEVRKFIDENKNHCRYFRIPKNHIENNPVIIEFNIKQDSYLIDDIIIEAEEGSICTFIVRYSSEEGKNIHHSGRIRVFAGRNSDVKVIRAQLMDNQASHNDIISGIEEDRAHIHVILAEMGAAKAMSSCNIVLNGKESSADVDILYMGDGTRSVDISARVEHKGKNSLSNIRARGVLSGQSRKILRDTIDFISGSGGSKGREEENVLMLDPGVMNLSVPILLCGEDDVEGEHAASSGRPDDKLMFYMMSRGISENEAKKILVEAAFSAILNDVPDISLQNEILDVLKKSIE